MEELGRRVLLGRAVELQQVGGELGAGSGRERRDLAVRRTSGPTVTQFEIEPAAGIKVRQIAALADDLALAMRAASIRIVAPIPGKARMAS